MVKLVLFVYVIFSLSGCATSVGNMYSPLASYDKDTKYGIEYNEEGFSIIISYSRVIPDYNVVATDCKSQLTAIAWEHSEKIGKEIEPINEQSIRIVMDQDFLSGLTSCQAKAKVKWKPIN